MIPYVGVPLLTVATSTTPHLQAGSTGRQAPGTLTRRTSMQVANSCTILYGPGLTRSDISPPSPHPKNKESLLRRRLGRKNIWRHVRAILGKPNLSAQPAGWRHGFDRPTPRDRAGGPERAKRSGAVEAELPSRRAPFGDPFVAVSVHVGRVEYY